MTDTGNQNLLLNKKGKLKKMKKIKKLLYSDFYKGFIERICKKKRYLIYLFFHYLFFQIISDFPNKNEKVAIL